MKPGEVTRWAFAKTPPSINKHNQQFEQRGKNC